MIEPELYICSGCGKEKDYLSESWRVVEFPSAYWPPAKVYFCLECISDKKEWHGDAR